MRPIFWLLLLLGVASATPSFAHASLVRAEPADRALLAAAPAEAVLTFNEPVTVIALRLIDAEGRAGDIRDWRLEGGALHVPLPADLPHGTEVLSYRVVSIDGHPIGGALLFSIGAETQASAVPTGDVAAAVALWLALFLFLCGTVVGIGGAFFARTLARLGPSEPGVRRPLSIALGVGALAGAAAIGLQGLDVLGLGLGGLLDGRSWVAGLTSTFGRTVIVGEVALGLAAVGLTAEGHAAARSLTIAALFAVGLAFSLSGHAASAPPQGVTATAVLLHGLGVVFWIGSLVPLAVAVGRRSPRAGIALSRFSQAIPFALLPLIGSGVLLAFVQIVHVSDLWTTAYGRVLAAKLAAVAGIFGLAAVNRFKLTRGVLAGDGASRRQIVRTIGAEIVLAGVVLALVATWRFTPPPRNLFAPVPPARPGAPGSAPEPAFVHVMNEKVMVDVNFSAGRPGRMSVTLAVNDPLLVPFDVKGVKLSLAHPGAGIEAIAAEAVPTDKGKWAIDDFLIPLAGRWDVTVNVLVNDFEDISMTAPMDIAR